jgi:thiosulfate/3-mercaptopyruvate sulfurtransferase
MTRFLLSILFCLAGMPSEPETRQKPSRHPRADLLVEAAELAKPEVARRFCILDARAKHKYLEGHVRGAVWIDAITWSRAGLTGQDQDEWAKRIGELGIGKDTHVVIYDDNASKDAARIWWILRYWGVRDARLLNGGWRAWETSGGEISAVAEKPPFLTPSLAADAVRLATKDQVLEALQTHEVTLVDARSRGEYCGQETTAKRNGAIPGAVHLEWLELLDGKSQRFKSPEALAELFQKSGIALDRPAITYCQSGGRAAVMAFALELMGAKQVRNYYKSWNEWGNALDTPIVKPLP